MQQVAGTTGVASVYSSPVFIKVLIRPETASGRDDWSSKSVQQSFFIKVLIRPETASGRDDWSGKCVQQSRFYKSSYQA